MLTFPCAKINLGLNITAERADGYHDLETVFYPVPLTDVLEIKHMDRRFPHDIPCDLKVTGNHVECDERQNLVVRAYELLAADYSLPLSMPISTSEYPHRQAWAEARRTVLS